MNTNRQYLFKKLMFICCLVISVRSDCIMFPVVACKYLYNESTAGADASVEASYNVASKKKPGDRSSDSSSYNVQRS